MTNFTREAIEDAFNELGRRAFAEGKVIDLAVYGGSALAVASNFRLSTRDIDAVSIHDQETVDQIAKGIGALRGWPDNWINDGVRMFLSHLAEDGQTHHQLFATYPNEAMPGLRVFVPTPQYLLAMKLAALRVDQSGDNKDAADLKNLLTICKIKTPNEAMAFLADFYPDFKSDQLYGLSWCSQYNSRLCIAGWFIAR